MSLERFAHMLGLKFRSLFRRSAVERELNEELRYHVEALAAQLRGQGLSPEEAHNRALQQFGGLEQYKEQCRDARGTRGFEEVVRDTKYAFRTLAKQPAFSLVVIGTIAVGIAANAAIFGVVNSVLFRPLSFPQAEQLVSVWEASSRFTGTSGASRDRSSCSYPNFEGWRRDNRVFEKMAVYFSSSFVFTGRDRAIRLQGAIVSAALFPLLGTQPLLGRTFLGEEDEPGNRSLILSYKLWQEHFGSDPSVLGRTATLDGQLYTIVGVMPAEFQFPVQNEPVELWTTIASYRAPPPEGGTPMTEQRENHFLNVIARLKTGISLEQAQANLDTIAARLAKQYPATNSTSGVNVVPLLRDLVGDVRPALLILFGAAVCVMLVAAANIANLLIARTISRQKEIAIRAALGAGRPQIVRQLLIESLVLASLGGICAGFLVIWALDAAHFLLPANFPRLTQIAPDWRLVLFAIGGVLLVGSAAALGPAWRVAQTHFGSALTENARGTSEGGRSNRLRSTLVVIELMFAVLLLCAGGLLLQTFLRLGKVPPGFDVDKVMTLRVLLPERSYPEPAKAADFFQKAITRVAAIPGINSAAGAYYLPLSGNHMSLDFRVAGREVPPEKLPEAGANIVTTGYFHALHIPLLRGRDFTERDNEQSPPVIIVSEAFARKYFPGEDPLGKRIKPTASMHPGGPPTREIIGVVGDVRIRSLQAPVEPEMYIPHGQFGLGGLSLVIRTQTRPDTVVPAVKQAIFELEKNVPVYNPKTLEQFVASSIAQPRLNAAIVVTFSAVALLLAAAGIFGIMSYAVSQRTRELGIRMALGAQRQQVITLVLAHSLKLILLGLILGIVAALLASRALQSVLFGIAATDLHTITAVSCLLTAVALFACWWPARRASRIDPVVALREA